MPRSMPAVTHKPSARRPPPHGTQGRSSILSLSAPAMAADGRRGHLGVDRSPVRDFLLFGAVAQVDAGGGRADETAPLVDVEPVGGLWRRVVARLTGAQQKFHVL